MKKHYAIVEEMIDDDGRIISQKHTGREVIECKDCIHGSPNGKYGCRVYHYIRYETHDMKPYDFCSRAERRTDE